MGISYWGLAVGEWGLVIGDWILVGIIKNKATQPGNHGAER